MADTDGVERTDEGVVVIDYNDIAAGKDLSKHIAMGVGTDPDCLGLLVVKNVPNYNEYRATLLPLSQKLANLPQEALDKIVDEKTNYNFGWSHGKEVFNGEPDTSKGSFYANPQYDNPVDDPELIAKHVGEFSPNIWPSDDLPELEPAFKALGQLIVSVAVEIAGVCDKYVKERYPDYVDNTLHDMIAASRCCKARLLHYFPREENRELSDDYASWCGWHLDHGAITGLCKAMYLTADGTEVPCPDPTAGLYIKNRAGNIVKATIPDGCLAFQIGESATILSGGALVATPHCVQGASGPDAAGISRETLACFTQPLYNTVMAPPPGANPDDIKVNVWTNGQTFTEFSAAKIASYYNVETDEF